MANIWNEKWTLNNENSQYAPMKSKQTLLNGNRNVHKMAFSEIKNVMHNQIGATPLKGNASKIDGLPSVFNPCKSLCNDVLRKQQLKHNFADAQNKLERKEKTTKAAQSYEGPVFDESLFDSWDRNRECCRNHTSDAEIWSQMDAMDMELSMSNFNPSLEDDGEKDLFAGPVGLSDLDNLPEILDFQDFNLMDEKTKGDPGLRSNKLPDFDAFNDELPF